MSHTSLARRDLTFDNGNSVTFLSSAGKQKEKENAEEMDKIALTNAVNITVVFVSECGDAQYRGRLSSEPSLQQFQEIITTSMISALHMDKKPWNPAQGAYNTVVIHETSRQAQNTRATATPSNKGQVQIGYGIDNPNSAKNLTYEGKKLRKPCCFKHFFDHLSLHRLKCFNLCKLINPLESVGCLP